MAANNIDYSLTPTTPKRRDPNKHSNTELNPVYLICQLVQTCEEVADARANAEHPAVEAETGLLGHLRLTEQYHFDNFVLATFPLGRPSCRSSKPRTG